MIREALDFGSGSFVGEIMQDQTFFDLPIRDQARMVGWADGCPVVTELTDPENTSPGRGPEAMLQRYATLNFWFGYIAREAEENNPELYEALMTSVPRSANEPVGKYEPESVPVSYLAELAPMNKLAGYGLPRIFVEQLGVGQDLEPGERGKRLSRGLEVLETAVAEASTPLQLLALVGEGLIHADVDPEQVFKHTMSKGWVAEHNTERPIQDFKKMLPDVAPMLWEAYCQMTDEQKNDLKVI